jgi:uroporphyrinogen decarboxylase
MASSSYWQGAIKAEPDFDNVLKVLRREVPSRPTLMELFHNGPLYRRVIGPQKVAEIEAGGQHVDSLLRLYGFRAMGYDYATVHASAFAFPRGERKHLNTISLNEGALITDRASFERYTWPRVEDFSTDFLEQAGRHLPDGMKLIVIGPGGVLENVVRLVGYENLCVMIYDDPALVGEIFDAVGSRLVEYYRLAVEHETVGAAWANDDWGFKTQTMLSPADMRRFVIPWHQRIAEVVHAAGRPVAMHSCGQLREVMEDVIEVIGHDGKHSYEDAIQPVEEAYEAWGRRIAIIGGIDVDFVCRMTPEQVHDRARAMIERTASRGGYALGTGNSVPEYVPHENFFALLSAAWEGRPGYRRPRCRAAAVA